MFTINLEKELVKNKQKEISNMEEILLSEANEILSNNSNEDIEILKRLKLDSLLVESNKVNDRVNRTYGELEKDRIFTKQDIENLCKTYCLKFLPIEYYKGRIDAYLPTKVKETEKKLGSKLQSNNLFIVAPANSFELTKYDRDPLLFTYLSDDKYYLVHKWGNDLSIFNLLKGFTFRNFWSFFLVNILLVSAPCFIVSYYASNDIISVVFSIIGVVYLFLTGLCHDLMDNVLKRMSKNWNTNTY